jgi:hypothetical protein
VIDHLLNFASAAAARNDPVLTQHMADLEAWRGSYVFTDIKSWRVSLDHSVGTDPETGLPIIVHAYRTGWSLMISLANAPPALVNHSNLIVAIDRDAVTANRTGMIVKANVTPAIMQDTRWEPVPLGANYPWGAWK